MKKFLITILLFPIFSWCEDLKGVKLFCFNEEIEKNNPFYFEDEILNIPFHFEIIGYDFRHYFEKSNNKDNGVGKVWISHYFNENNRLVREMPISDFQSDLRFITFYNNECLTSEKIKNNISDNYLKFYPKCIEDVLYRDTLKTRNGYSCEINQDSEYPSIESYLLLYTLKVERYISQEKNRIREQIKSNNKL